ncbi:MAG: carbonic anhydrase [Patescibacteria group bacterium]
MSHNCDSIVLHCIDWRIQTGLDKWLRSGVAGTFDRVGLAGAVKSLITPINESDKDFLLRQIKISRDLHGIKTVILVNHSDCGAYKGAANFVNQNDEACFHARELKLAADIIHQMFPELKTELYIAQLSHNGQCWETKVDKV